MKYTVIILLSMLCCNGLLAQSNQQTSKALLERVIPERANQFLLQSIPSENGQDVFEIQTRDNKIVLSGNNGVSIAAALYYYLNKFCHAQITWNGTNLHLPVTLPRPAVTIHQTTPYEFRYYLNYCTFNYSMSWWDWPRWEKEIDWMALHGINMPLAITGEEYTWYMVYKEMGFSDADLKGFFCGPAYFSWFWMGNLDGWGGPLPLHWMETHYELEKKILQRERALGMKPVMPAFTGHVPAAFRKKFPGAKLKTTNWNNGFDSTYILDASDPLFAAIGKRFLEKQTRLLGTDHLYSADTFNENEPPSDQPAFLSGLSSSIYQGMHQADTAAVWVMQGWLFYSDRKFWKEPQTKALLQAVPDNKMILLDLATEIEPIWKRTEAFYGKPWIWNMLNNFGANTNLFGRMETVATEPAKALKDANSKKMKGIGLTMEGIEQNPVLYELLLDNIWKKDTINLDQWLPQYIRNRYGSLNPHAVKAWDILRRTVYTVPGDKYIRDGAESILQGRPTFDSVTRWTNTKLNYTDKNLLPAWDALILAADSCKKSDGFQFDLVDLTRQVLANYALPLQQKISRAYQQQDTFLFTAYSRQFISLIEDMDKLLATRKEFLLGNWVTDSRKWGVGEKEKALYEFNAKDIITLWGDQNCPLHEYACRQWSGLLTDFYKPRWQQFFAQLQDDQKTGKDFDKTEFTKRIKAWEWQWVNTRKDYPIVTAGNPIEMSVKMFLKYRSVIAEN